MTGTTSASAAHDQHDTPAGDVVDGRRLRRERNRRAVLDAMIDLVLEHDEPPSAEAVAERAGVSLASLFRYFETLDDMRRHGTARYFERFDDLLAVPDIGVGPLAARIESLVAARDAFYTRTAPMARLARRRSADVDALADTLVRVRATLAEQIEQHFAPELGALDPAPRGERVAVLAALTSFESWDQLDNLGDGSRRRALRSALADLLG